MRMMFLLVTLFRFGGSDGECVGGVRDEGEGKWESVCWIHV